MSKALIIAEKPSVAQDIARAVGDATRKKDYFETPDYLITSAIGHLVEIYDAEETQKKANGGKWSFTNLPVLPQFDLRPIKTTEARVKLIQKLASNKEVATIINACDAGREGELIFHYIAEYLKLTKPTSRLWLQSLTKKAILDGLADLRTSTELDQLRKAAVARSEADWLIGINATRALTALNSKDGGFLLTTAGRVQTPTLALLVAREKKRREHVPRAYWTLEVEFSVANGNYLGKWVKPKKDPANEEDSLERIWEHEQAEQLAKLCQQGSTGHVVDSVKERKLSPPALFDLNELQREANKLYSLPARRTLGAAQALYDRYKLLTYPRTESRHLPTDYVSVAEQTLAKLAASGSHASMAPLAQHCHTAQAQVAKVGKRVFDQSKVTDHFAIIPTGMLPKDTLPDIEQKIFDLVCRRFVGVFLPPALVRETTRITTLKDEQFRTRGRIIAEAGWLAVARSGNKDSVIPALANPEETATVTKTAELSAKETKPIARYNDASLLGAMQRAADFVEEAELSEALKAGGGLGTPATRASVIEELIRTDYMVRDSNEIIPTAKAFSLMEILTDMQIGELTKPDLTATWENRLRGIEAGSEDEQEFIANIGEMAKRIVAAAKEHDPDATTGNYATLTAKCPSCKTGAMQEGYRKYSCQNPECKSGASDSPLFIWKTVAGRQLTPAEADTLIATGRVGPFDNFRSKRGFAFIATLVLGASGKIDMEFPDEIVEEVDLATATKVGTCPKCTEPVLQAPLSFCCQDLLNHSGKCDFKISRTYCHHELELEEVAQLLDKEKFKTALIKDFISKRGKPFSAYLNLEPKSGKVKFEFEERKATKKKTTKKSTKNYA